MEFLNVTVPDTCADLTEDRWCIEFEVDHGGRWVRAWVHNTSRDNAEKFMLNWRTRADKVAIFCPDCPIDNDVVCRHDAPSWSYRDLVDPRIYPMPR